MKIALCISGQFRYVKNAVHKLKKYLIEPYDCDIFMFLSTETSKENKNQTTSNSNVENILKNEFGHNLKGYLIIEKKYYTIDKDCNIVKLHPLPISCATWERVNSDFSSYVNTQNFSECFKKCNEIDMFVHPKTEKEYLCNELKRKYEKENNFLYDLVMVTRIDIDINEEIFKFNNNPEPNTIYNFKSWECIFYGDSKSIDVATKKWNILYNNMCHKFGYDNLNIDERILKHITPTANGTGGVDVGLIHKWLKEKLVIKQINTFHPNYVGGVYRDENNILVIPPKNVNLQYNE